MTPPGSLRGGEGSGYGCASAPRVQDGDKWPLDHAYFRDAAKRIVAAVEEGLGKTAGSPEDRRYWAECFTYGAGLARHYLALSCVWRPIAEAPRDGSNVLIMASRAYSPEARVGWWKGDGWYFYSRPSKHDAGGHTRMVEADLWQPLPPPPSAEDARASTERGEADPTQSEIPK